MDGEYFNFNFEIPFLFSSDADHISFLSFENRTKYYDNQLFTSSIAVVLSQILQLKIHDSIRSLYGKSI